MLDGAWEKHRSYWRETLSGNLPVLELPTDRLRSKAQLFSGAVISTSIESSLAAQIQSFGKTQRVNPSTIFLALFKILLHRYTNLDDIIVGMPSMGRPQERFRSVVGYFINMVAIRSKGFSQQTFATFLENLKYTMSDGLDHARVPFTTVVRDIGILPNAIAAPIFQVAFEYQNGLAPGDLQHLCSCYGDLFDLEISFDIHQEGEYELVLEVFEAANGYRVSFKYNPSLYDVTTIQQMLGHYLQLTQVAISNPNALVHKYEMMDDAERRLIQWDLNATSVEYPSNCVHQLFQAQVERTPNAVAVACGERTLSYEELNRKSTALAKYLQQQGVQSETLVAVCVERSLDMIVALLGIMKAGGAYVPLDPQFPQERLTYMLRDCGAPFLVTQSWLNNRIGFIDAQYINLDRQWDEIEQAAKSVEPLKCLAGLENLAYVIYTSGSTGKPKGVTIEHRALTNFLCGMADQIGKQFVADFLAVTTYSFDIAALELFLPLIQGGRCTICDRDRLKDVEAIKAEIRRSKPTIMQATPSFWTMLLQSGWKNDENLKILCGGEMLNDSLRSMFASIGCEVWNLYGPTETTIWSMLAKIQPGDSVTIGKPIANTRVYILDAHDQLAPMGVPGELCIAGAGLARGYWNQPELTALRFIDHPLEANNGSKLYRTGDLCCCLPNGTLQHLGRLDLQVKIRGFRIELEEVERELSRHPAVAECVVVAKERQGVQSLIGYYVPRQSDENNLLQDFDLIAHLKQRLPDYAIPTAFISLDRIPLTANGKVDRKSLANQEVAIQRKTEKVTAKTETEAILADIWKNVLNVTDISINDGFFAAGGDSVLSVILADRIARRFNREFSVTSLFKYSTIRDIAAYLGDKQAEILGETPLQNPMSATDKDKQDRVALVFGNAKGEALPDSLAIIGISCHFPDAPNHYQFWQNICAGKESGQFFSEEELRQAGVSEDLIRNPHFVGVQRTIEGKGNFDPEFFNISPRNAVFMDPQFRLLLMHAWRAVEDAGYVSSEIPRTSVFISASNSGYNTLVDKAGIIEATDEYTAWMLSQSGTIPTTISYQLGLIGPSVFVHTNCSSSLAALSAAYQSLSLGQSDYALVGASTLLPKSEMGYLHRPGLNLSRDGHCRTFDAAADGLVAGEGVAVLLVKKAPLAIADGDRIYALIRGIGINNDGRDKAGFFAPSVRGQSQAIDMALTSTGIGAETIGYVEAHGTGTKLGDPIEIQALCDSYQKDTNQRQYCAIGSVKPNIGHLDTGAGLAGCIKVAMSLYHKKIPPSINFSQPNPAIDFERSPFFVVDRLHEWEAAPWPRRAALSAFGIGGTNTHAILEEYLPSPKLSSEKLNSPVLIVLSARKDERLKEYVGSLADYLEQGIAKPNDSSEAEWLINLAYTLQCGRQAMESRVAFIASSVEELIAKLRRFATHWQPFEGCYFGSPSTENQILKLFADDEDIQGLLAQWLVKRNLAKLAQIWIQGVKVDWSRLYCDHLPSRISAPTYPFAPEYYWPTPNPSSVSFSTLAPSHAIDPLQHRNVSVSAQHYSYEFTGHEFFLADHQIRHNGSGRKVLPAVVYLEMVHRAFWQSISHSLPNLEYPVNSGKSVIVLSDIAWVQALFVDESPTAVELKLFNGALNQMRFEIGSTFKGKTSLHCHGDAAVRFNTAPVLNLLELQQQIQDRQLSSAECYEIFRTLGVDYGPAHHAIDTLFLSAGKTSDRQVLAKLVIPDAVAQEQSRYILHPSLLDAGLQSCVGLLLTNSQESLRLALPSSLEQIEVYDSCAALMWAWVRFAPETKKDSPIQRIDIDLCTDDGKVSVRMKGFVAREIRQQDSDGAVTQHQPKPLISNEMPPGLGSVTLKPVWDRVAIAPQAERSEDSLTVVFGANQTWKDQIAQLNYAAVLVDSAKPQSVEEFSKQIELLGSIDRLLWLAPAPIKYALDDDRVVDEQESGVLQLFRLLKSLFESGYGKKSLALTVVTSQSVAVRPFETANPLAASIHGLVATLKSEYPHWRVRLLDIDGGELPSMSELFPYNDTVDFPLLARRYKQWFARKLIPIAFESKGFPAYKQKGVYVVIGGAGGVGEVWSRHIIENYQAQVIWIGRRELDAQIREKQAKLAAFGSKPLYIQADARNKASLEKALEEIRQSYSCINGVVHSAIELQDQSLAQMSITRFRTGLLAKAETSVRLVQVFQHEPLDLVLFFSSLISFGESPGQANYAAGCTFLDAYAQQLGKEWAVSVKVMNWGYWGNAGVVADATYRERMRQNGIGSIEPQQAMAALDRLLQGQIDQLAFINLLKPQALEFVIEDEVLSVVGSARSQAHPVVENVAAEIRYSQQLQLIRTHRTDARDALLQNLLLANLSEMGVLNSPQARLPVTYYHKWLDESIRLLQQNGLLIRQENVSSVEELWTTWQKARLDWEGSASVTAEINLVERCLRSLPDILSGRKFPQDVIFPESSLRLVEPLYRGNPIADFFNEVIADAVVDAINSLDKGNGSIRILEVGAGTGGTTVGLLQKLAPYGDRIGEYCYTDISQAFLIHAQEHYAIDYPFLKVDRFNVEQPLSTQSIQPGSYDIVVATNVLHATKNIRQTVRNVKAAMREGGQIFINEISGNSLFSHLTFGLLEGWWRFEDAEMRIPGCPALNSHAWKQVLQEEGFDAVKFPVQFAHDLGHQIVVATSNGVIRQPLLGKPHAEPESVAQTQLDDSSNVQTNSIVSLKERTTEFVRQTLAEATRTPANKVRLDAPFEQYGVDSIVQVGLIQKLEQVTGSLPNTILFEYSTTRELVDYLLAHHQEFLTASFPTRIDETEPASSDSVSQSTNEDSPSPRVSPQPAQNTIASDTANAAPNISRFVQDDIAIVGIAGRYPGAKNLDELWEVLRTGRSCIVEADRFRRSNLSDRQHSETPARSHFGGFLNDVYHFDRQLFGVSEERAIAMPPEVRLFLEITWETFEAAGYSRAALKQFQLREKKGIGVFVGSMYSQYAWTNPSRNEAVLSSNGTEWQIANQVSHFFDLTGPSLVLNTACSSSLTAIHLACESLRQGSCSMALAGGVNLTLEPSKFLSLERSNFLGSGQHSRSLGDGDGMIPSEGVGALLLKPLSLAIADNDRIEGIIKSSFVNHSGGRQAFTAPDPAQQTQLVLDSIARSGCDIETITYVESAANGSSLGDPIEIIALKNAFAKLTNKTGFCAIGSVKSNLGHLEAASGISQIAKVLLQFQQKTLVPTINATPRNPRIKLDNSPFYLQEQLSPWVPQSDSHNSDLPRRSLINSFGAGGSYANLIVEEYQEKPSNTTSRPHPSETLLVFAAATQKGLQSYLTRLQTYLREHPAISVADLASALQLRDCNLEYRLAAIASSTNQALNVVEQLAGHNVDVSNPGIYASFGGADLPTQKDAQLQSAIDARDLFRLARYWAAGADIDFARLNRVDRKSCVVLPRYAFEHDKEFSYIIHDSQEDTQATAEPSVSQTSGGMTATYLYDEPFLQDHTLLGDRVLLGVTHASLAMTDFFQRFPHQRALCLKRLTFVQPIIVDRGEAVTIEIHTSEIPTGLNFEARYRRTTSKQLTQTAATGHLQPDLYKEEYLDVERLLESCTPGNLESIYHTVPAIRLGSSFRTIERLFRTSDGIIARVCLTEQSRQESHTYALHPLAINSAFLAAAPLLANAIGNDSNYLPFGIREIYCVKVEKGRSLDRCWVYTRLVKNSGELILFDADIISDNSLVVARLRGCSLKLLHDRKEPQQASPESPKAASIDASILETSLAADVLRYLIDKINITAQISIAETEVNTNLMQLGLGSSELVAIAASIEQDTDLEVNATLFFEYPSLMEVVNFFVDSHPAAFLQLLGEKRTQHSTTPEKLDSSISQHHEKVSAKLHGDIAVIGMHSTYAECEDLDRFWQLIRDGRDVIREVPRDRWDYRPWFDPNPGSEDKTYCKWGSFIKDADKFDAAFFNISPREAMWMDPQNRLLMQSMYAAAEDAGVVNQLRGSNTGVFAGICFDDYAEKIVELGLPLDIYTGTGRSGISANRISFWFDFKGPSMVINTACSSSLVALHYACQALRNKECEMAFVGGANLLLSSLHYRYFSKLGALSPSGHCHTFDAAADGYVPAECIASILLKPLEQAQKDGDRIHAVIKGSAFAHGGYTPSLSAPSVAGEENVIVKAWEDAGIDPETLTYIEAHGTGTKLGDPIETNSLKNAFARYTSKTAFCAIGSVKANIGHAEGAAGITGLIKVILQIKHCQIPPLANLKQPNPYLKLEGSPHETVRD